MLRTSGIVFLSVLLLCLEATAQNEVSPPEKKGKPVIQVFSTLYYNPGSEKPLRFIIGRAHLGYQYRFDDHFFAKIVLDRGRPTMIGPIFVSDTLGNQYHLFGTINSGSYYSMTLKFAFLEWKANEHFKIQFGSVLQNHYITQERFWGYRYVAQTFIDRYYHIPSGDLGFIAYYRLNNKFGFDLAVTNGEGFRFDQDNWGKVKVAAGVDLNFIKNLQLRVFYHNKTSGDSINSATEQLLSFFAGYKHKKLFRIGFEINYMLSYLNVPGLNSGGISVYGSVHLWKKFDAFARFDVLEFDKPEEIENIHFNNGNALITGIQFRPIDKVGMALNYQGWFANDNNNLNLIAFSLEFEL